MAEPAPATLSFTRAAGGGGAWAVLRRNTAGLLGVVLLAVMVLACLGTLPWTLGKSTPPGFAYLPEASRPVVAPIEHQERVGLRLPPSYWAHDALERQRYDDLTENLALRREADQRGVSPASLTEQRFVPSREQQDAAMPVFLMGTDVLGRDVTSRVLAGGAISLGIGIAAAAISVFVGTMYGAIAGYVGGRVDDVMMRIVDVLYGLPYVLLVVLLAVASDAMIDELTSRSQAKEAWIREQARLVAIERGWDLGAAAKSQSGGGGAGDSAAIAGLLSKDKALRAELEAKADATGRFEPIILSEAARTRLDLLTLLIAIGGVSWLTLARVIRGQVLSLREQPFMEAARALGIPLHRVFFRHLLPNLTGPIIVYATLTVPQAILQESFLSFLGIGVKPPLPSWGNLASDGLSELNTVHSNWWLLVFPCLLLGLTLLSLNMMGEALREAMDPRRLAR